MSYDLFYVKQYQGETLKEYINRFGAQVVKVGTTEEPMIIYAFRKGMCPGPFFESIIRSRPRTFAEIRRRAVEHIATEGEVCEKRTSVAPTRPRASYEARRPQTRGRTEEARWRAEGNRPVRNNFVVELKDLIVVPNIADRLRAPAKTDKVLGPHKDAWCEFHQAFGHHINNCLALGHQLDELVKSGFLKDYMARSSTVVALAVPEQD